MDVVYGCFLVKKVKCMEMIYLMSNILFQERKGVMKKVVMNATGKIKDLQRRMF